METMILVIALVLIGAGLYGVWPIIRGSSTVRPRPTRVRGSTGVAIDRSSRVEKSVIESLQRSMRETTPVAVPTTPTRRSIPIPAVVTPGNELEGEVGELRTQLEQLKHELGSLSHREPRAERPSRARGGGVSRYRVGVYSSLPPVLRQQVQEARHTRVHV